MLYLQINHSTMLLFQHFASKKQLPGFYISGTLVENGLNVTDPLIFALIYIFLSRREKTHDNKEFSHKNSKRRRESRITTR